MDDLVHRDSEAIRRRLERGYVFILAPSDLDDASFRAKIVAIPENTEVVLDLEATPAGGTQIFVVLNEMAATLAARHSSLVLTNPSEALLSKLESGDLDDRIVVRRPKTSRPGRPNATDPGRR